MKLMKALYLAVAAIGVLSLANCSSGGGGSNNNANTCIQSNGMYYLQSAPTVPVSAAACTGGISNGYNQYGGSTYASGYGIGAGYPYSGYGTGGYGAQSYTCPYYGQRLISCNYPPYYVCCQ